MIQRDRKIFMIGDIDHEMFSKFTRKLGRLEEESDELVHIVLCSDGGTASIALAIHDRIKMSSCPISVCGIGLVASAAALILVAPEIRAMTSSSWLMVHDDEFTTREDARVVDGEKAYKHARRVEDQWNDLMAKATGTNADIWDKLHRAETYLTALECLSSPR